MEKYEKIVLIASQTVKAERTWFKSGSFHENQGFSVFPHNNDEIDLLGISLGISKTLTEAEARLEIEKPFCTNSETAKLILQAIDII